MLSFKWKHFKQDMILKWRQQSWNRYHQLASSSAVHAWRTVPSNQSEAGQVPQQHRGTRSSVHQESHQTHEGI